jgi:hypothetical protein
MVSTAPKIAHPLSIDAQSPKHPPAPQHIRPCGAAGVREAAKNQNFSQNFDVFVQISTFRRDAPQISVKIGELWSLPQISEKN